MSHEPHFSESPSRSHLRWLAVTALALSFGILVVPYGVPPSNPPTSASALVGFNNTLSYVIYVPLLAVAAWVLSSLIRWPAKDVFTVPEVVLPAPGAWVWGVLGGHAALFALLYGMKGQFVFSEALYFQHTAYRVVSGETPYAGFSYLYGPATVYPQALLARIVSLPTAYALYYVGVYLLGLYALYVALAWFGFDGRRADALFVILAVGFFNPLAGLNYTPLRHLLPLLAVVAAWSYVIRGSWRWLVAGSLIVWMAVMYSPDVGAVALGGVLLTGGVSYSANRFLRVRSTTSERPVLRVAAILAVAAVLTVGVFAALPDPVAGLSEYAAVVMRLAGGGSNTPVQASVPLAALITLTAAASGAAVALFRARGVVQDTVLLGAVVVTLVVLQRAAFAKPDILHLAFAALPMFIVGLKLFAGDSKRVVPLPLALGLLGLVAPLQYYNAAATWPAVTSRLSARSIEQPVQPPTPVLDQAVAPGPIPEQLQALVTRMGGDTPYYMHNLTYYSLPVYIRNRLRHALYFTTPEEAFTDVDVENVIRTLAARDTIVVALREDLEGAVRASPNGSRFQRALNMLVASAVSPSITHDATATALRTLWSPFLGYLRRCYEVREETADLVALVRSHDRPACGDPTRS